MTDIQSQKAKILVIDDEESIRNLVTAYLRKEGYDYYTAGDGRSGLKAARAYQPDLIVLDIMLPGMDGLTLCRRFREQSETPVPVLMLTAKDTLEEKLEGFDAGADDYLLKPFALQELEARLQALVRRFRQEDSREVATGTLCVDKGRRQVTVNGKPVSLNRTCFRILVELIRRAPDVVSREDLEHMLWGDVRPASDALRSHIYTLRRAVDSPGETSRIETVTGFGFRIREVS